MKEILGCVKKKHNYMVDDDVREKVKRVHFPVNSVDNHYALASVHMQIHACGQR